MTQVVELLPSGTDKWSWLTRRLVEFTSTGSVLIFVTKKANCEELATNLTQEGYSLGLLHGDMDQSERNKVISDFKKKNLPILVATDVAGEYNMLFVCLSIQFSALYIKSWKTKLMFQRVHLHLLTFSCFLFLYSPASSWSGHPIHSHSGELRRGTRHRHAHAQDRSNWSCWREGCGSHSPHQQRHNICRWPREKFRGS